MIRIGNQTAFSAAPLTAPFDYALAQGFEAFEWFPDKKPDGAGWDAHDLSPSQRLALRAAALERGLRLSLHARWHANPLRRESRVWLEEDLALASSLGATLLNLHLWAEAGLDDFLLAVNPLVRATAAAGLQLAFENTPDHAPEVFNELFARLRSLDATPVGHVGMCFDLGHANLCAATRNDYLGFLDRLNPWVPIIHVHLHENWGDADAHLPLFTGPAGRDDAGIRGLLERLRRRRFAGSIILEQWPQPPALLNQARDRLRQLLDEVVARADTAPAPEPHPSPDSFLEQLVQGNQRCRSWREKLDFLRGLFLQETTPLSPENLADLAVFVRWLASGQIPCAEDGRHFRPAHHARIALQIQQRLAQLSTPATAFILRRIYPWLPSSGQTFQRPEPLTRIRDLAHRNDIPPALKREIKHSLQNKLHRCAGPEDLATSAALLERLTRPGAGYPEGFVADFKLFHEELKEFFSARSLEERLHALAPRLGAEEADLIRSFLVAKSGTGLREQLAALNALTKLRQALLRTLGAQPSFEPHELLLTEIGLEDFAFVLLSEILNAFDAPAAPLHWELWLETLVLTLTNQALSNLEPQECQALEAEVRAWRHHFDPVDAEQLLRLKATLDRARRLAEAHSDRVLALFPPRAEKLGRALGVAPHAIRVFCDAEIRGQLIFQLSKLVTGLLRHLRQHLAWPAWDVLVVGQAVGRLQSAPSLETLGPHLSESAVVLLEAAEGDEEIPTGVKGIVLAHPIPHLSHLGIRARQAGVVLVACEDPARFQDLRRFAGQTVLLAASAETLECHPVAASVAPPPDVPPRTVCLPAVSLTPARVWLPLADVTPETGGGKSFGARRLAELAASNQAGFQVPAALVIPFGVPETALTSAPELEAEYRQTLARLADIPPAEFATATERLRDLIRQVPVPAGVVAAVTEHFSRHSRLIVRSSANGEDLDDFAGAGLYESVPNVAAADVAAAVRVVWSSLWTRRAAWSRQQAGIPHAQAHVAILIQELLTPDFSFVLHTVNPISRNAREVYAELAVGLGETLASAAAPGNPYRLVLEKETGAVKTLAFGNFSHALWPDPAGGLTRQVVDYSGIDLSSDPAARQRWGRRLAAVARLVEAAFQRPLDLEGAVVGDAVYLVQARPQQGLTARAPR